MIDKKFACNMVIVKALTPSSNLNQDILEVIADTADPERYNINYQEWVSKWKLVYSDLSSLITHVKHLKYNPGGLIDTYNEWQMKHNIIKSQLRSLARDLLVIRREMKFWNQYKERF